MHRKQFIWSTAKGLMCVGKAAHASPEYKADMKNALKNCILTDTDKAPPDQMLTCLSLKGTKVVGLQDKVQVRMDVDSAMQGGPLPSAVCRSFCVPT